MNTKQLFLSIAGIVVVAAVVGGMVGGIVVANKSQTGGDFAGGIQPSPLFTASAVTNSVTPNLSNFFVTGAISAGGVSANSQLTAIYTAVTVWPTLADTILSSSTPYGSATTTQVAFTAPGFSVGDPCEVEYTGTTSTLLTSANVTAVNGSAVTTTVQFLNASGASITAAVTSTITGVSSTVKTTCVHTGV